MVDMHTRQSTSKRVLGFFSGGPPPSHGINLRRPPQTSLVYQPRRHATSRCVALRRAASLALKASSWRPPLDRRFNGKSFLFRDMGRVTNKQLRHSTLASPWRHSSNCLRFAGLNSLTNRLFYDDVLITRRYPKEISARETSGWLPKLTNGGAAAGCLKTKPSPGYGRPLYCIHP